MKIFINMVKLILLSVFIMPTQVSCDFIVEKRSDSFEMSSSAKTRIDIYKREAILLLKASQNNIDILQLCQNIKNVDTLNHVSYLTNRLENIHFEISKSYDDLAEDKLISIPKYERTYNVFNKMEYVDEEAFIASNLKLILNKTESQIQLLDALGNVTQNIDFKIMVIKDTQKLKSNINKIEVTLNRLNKRVQEPGTNKLLL